jgi:hypothetical protein
MTESRQIRDSGSASHSLLISVTLFSPRDHTPTVTQATALKDCYDVVHCQKKNGGGIEKL